jgi:hypothetical protein
MLLKKLASGPGRLKKFAGFKVGIVLKKFGVIGECTTNENNTGLTRGG